MNNLTFLHSIGVTDTAVQQKCLSAMEKYGENKWWEPDVDPRQFAYYQLHEDILLTSDFHHFHVSVELLLGRPVFTHEFGIAIEGLRQEAQRAWTYQVGVTSDAERAERASESIEKLHAWAEKRGKKVIEVHMPDGGEAI